MQAFPIAYMPSIPPPCFSLRSRRETNTVDTANVRLTEHWQADSPSLTNSLRGVQGSERYQDMNPTPSRLYREDMRQSQPYVVPLYTQDLEFDEKISYILGRIQSLKALFDDATEYYKKEDLRKKITDANDMYLLLLTEKKQSHTDTMSKNPYFEKYSIRDDPRNIVRELRACVSEDIVDRGIAESQKLIKRGFENRWLPAHFAETQGLDSLAAYDLMRPKFNDQTRSYN